MSAEDLYFDVLRRRLGSETWNPALPLGADLEPGMAGTVTSREFRYAYRITDRGIPDPAVDDRNSDVPDDLDLTTSDSLEIDVKLEGDTSKTLRGIAAAEAGVHFRFGREGAMVCTYRSLREHRIRDERALAADMVKSWQGGQLPKVQMHDVVITQTLTAGWGLCLVAEGRGAEATVKADVDAGSGAVTLANVKGAVELRHDRQLGLKRTSPHGAVVAWRGLELRQRGWFWVRAAAEPYRAKLVADEEEPFFAIDEVAP